MKNTHKHFTCPPVSFCNKIHHPDCDVEIGMLGKLPGVDTSMAMIMSHPRFLAKSTGILLINPPSINTPASQTTGGNSSGSEEAARAASHKGPSVCIYALRVVKFVETAKYDNHVSSTQISEPPTRRLIRLLNASPVMIATIGSVKSHMMAR